MIKETAIRDRFIGCLDEVRKTDTNVDIAKNIGCTKVYLSAVRKSDNPAIPSAVLANFCVKYGYNPTYILTGKGDRRMLAFDTPIPNKERDFYIELVGKLLDHVLDPTRDIHAPDSALTDLIGRANKKLGRN